MASAINLIKYGAFTIATPAGGFVIFEFDADYESYDWWFKKAKPEIFGREYEASFLMLKNYIETCGYTAHGHAITSIDAPIEPATLYHIFTNQKAIERGYYIATELPDDIPMYHSKYEDKDKDKDEDEDEDEEGIPRPFTLDEEPEY